MSAILAVLPATRKEAIATGSKHYFTGRPCKRGYVAKRYTCDSQCAICACGYNREYDKTPERRQKNRDYQRNYAKAPKRREYNRVYKREYDKQPKWREYGRESLRRRYASKRYATPPWLTADHIDQMRAIYSEAACLSEATGVLHHVDHIVPLTHPEVQGLHVPWNPQILTAGDNWRKNNAFDGTHENESWRQA